MIICSDITQRKTAEESLKKEQELLRHMLDLLERDRELIAFEIHDGFAQQLTGAQLLLESFEELRPAAPEEARRAYLEGMRLVRESIHQSRRLVSDLRPPVLGEFGVLPAIEHLIEENRKERGPEVEYSAPDELPRLARPLENALFRIVEESLTNARRHSRSDRVRLEVSLETGWVRVVMCDFGVGFDPCVVDPERFGLRGIRERARLLGGRVQIESAPGRGTSIRVELPLVPRMDASAGRE
jgi:signal transduction histidine kinase